MDDSSGEGTRLSLYVKCNSTEVPVINTEWSLIPYNLNSVQNGDGRQSLSYLLSILELICWNILLSIQIYARAKIRETFPA